MAITLTAAVPLTPSLVAMMVALPGANAVTNPLAETVATETSLLAQLTNRPVKASPALS